MSDSWLAGPLTTTAYGWRLERRDGVTLAFTSHDSDILIEGLLHRASPGMLPSSILVSGGLETDGLEMNGNLDSTAISEDDLKSGRWNRARVRVYLFDWTQPNAGKRILTSGELGEVSYSGSAFSADMRGLVSLLDGAVVPQTSASCRAQFCDTDCGLSQRRYYHTADILAVDGDILTFATQDPIAANALSFGRLRWVEGKNCGLSTAIVAHGQNQLTLTKPPAFPVEIPARVELFEGCDKTISTCSSRFSNAANFRGEPYLPGNDLLTRYPGAG